MDSTAMATSVAASPLFKLSAELRLQIYEYVMESDRNTFSMNGEKGCCRATRADGIPEPALLFTCKAVREEAIQTFYTVNIFAAVVEDCHPAAHVLMARKKVVLQAMGMDTTKIEVRNSSDLGKNFQNLILWLQHVHQGDMIPSTWAATRFSSAKMKLATTARFIHSFINIAKAMRGSPWAEDEKILRDLRGGLIAFDVKWKEDV
jgi:hypothetical protein